MKKLKAQDQSYTLLVENLDDVWFLSHIITSGDALSGEVERKIKVGAKDTAVRKKFYVTLAVEKIEYTQQSLRVNGIIRDGPEDLERGAYQSISLDIGTTFTLRKETWSQVHKKKLDDALKGSPSFVLAAIDRDVASIAQLGARGKEHLHTLRAQNLGKQYDVERGDFFAEAVAALVDTVSRLNVEGIIIGCPSFWKANIDAALPDDAGLRKKIRYVTVHGGLAKHIDEILQSKEVEQFLAGDALSRQMHVTEEILTDIAKHGNDGKSAYGFDACKDATDMGACDVLLVTDAYVHDVQEKGKYGALDALLELCIQMKGEVHIVTASSDAGEKIDGLGGIVAKLRYPLSN